MKRLRMAVYGVLAVLTVGTVVAMSSGAALAQDDMSNGNGLTTATGGADQVPAYQSGNAQGDGRGQ
jgi:hypothetical protein